MTSAEAGSGLWRHHDFLHLWAGQTISQFGTQISRLALPFVAIMVLDASAFEVSLLTALEFLPYLLFALPAGVWVDRLRRKPILVLADLGRAAALVTIPLAAAFDAITIGQLYVVGFAVGALSVFFDLAYQSYLPALVGQRQLVDANAKVEVTRSAAQVGGPGLAGLLVAALTAPYAVAADALSFVASAVFLLRMRTIEPAIERPERRSVRAELVEGLRYLLSDARWRAFAGYAGSINFFAAIVLSILLVYAVRSLGLTAAQIGFVLAVSNAGSIVAALTAERIAGRLGVGPTMILGGILSGVPLLLLPLASDDWAIPLLLAPLVVQAYGIVLFNVTGISYVQAVVPDRMLGRMTASRRFIVWGTIPLGSLTGGVLASTIGLHDTIAVGAIGATFCFLWLVFSPFRSTYAVPALEADA